MTPARYDEAKLLPLTTNALIEARVADLVGRAIRRQLWVLFLDERDVQLPLLVPLEGLPQLPPDPSGPADASGFSIPSMLRHFMDATGARSFIFVLERYADASLARSDVAWARALHGACDEVRVPLRGILVSHRRGVRWVAQDDYWFENSGNAGGAATSPPQRGV